MSVSSNVDEAAMVAIVTAGPLTTREEVADFLDATADERALLIENARLRGLAPVASSWDTFVSVLGTVVAIAGVVTGITSAISGVYAVKATL